MCQEKHLDRHPIPQIQLPCTNQNKLKLLLLCFFSICQEFNQMGKNQQTTQPQTAKRTLYRKLSVRHQSSYLQDQQLGKPSVLMHRLLSAIFRSAFTIGHLLWFFYSMKYFIQKCYYHHLAMLEQKKTRHMSNLYSVLCVAGINVPRIDLNYLFQIPTGVWNSVQASCLFVQIHVQK